ncbi:lipopolysaccharide biosynthesis protein [Bacteroidota bacterium]
MANRKRTYYPLIKSELFRNISILISGTALAQLIPILLQPILRRYYTPETFGAYTVYLSLLGILIVISSLKYELAIILPKKEKEAANVLFLAILLNLLMNGLILLIIIIWNSRIAGFLNLNNVFAKYLYAVPLGTFLLSFFQSINYWLIRKKRFFTISKNKFIRRGIEGGSQVGFKFVHLFHGLILGDIAGHFANISYGIFQAVKNGLKPSFFSFIKLKYVFKKYQEYPKFNVIPSLMSACSYLLPAIFINKYFSTVHAGFFDLSKLVLSIPLALIATSLSNVLLQRISEKYRTGESFILDLVPVFWVVLIIAVLEITVIRIWGVKLFLIFFGQEWEDSGIISRVLVWSFTLNFFSASFSSLFISMKKIKLLSLWQLVYFLAILSLILFKDLPFKIFIRNYVIIEVSCYILISFLISYIIWKYERGIVIKPRPEVSEKK